MNSRPVRVRFAPSPTGGLHLGGVRTALFNFLYARQQQGTFVLRIEDTDQNRFVEGAEKYIFDCLAWCGLAPDESVQHGGDFGPYRQSERKEIYRRYVDQLIASGHAYYAFDTVDELAAMREQFKTKENPTPQYDHHIRKQMRNSLTLSQDECDRLIADGCPYVIRIKIPEQETVAFHDLIRGDIRYETATIDDKVLLKADGMPTYHLASVVDDYLMQISHVFRGEEWLPSAPVHLLLWKYLGWESEMPQWAHLPLILKPDGNGKLSKRDGERLGFPVFAMDWKDPKSGDLIHGFKENGFLPEAFVNMLAMLGWNPGSEQEIFTLSELCESFSLDRVHKGGAKFDFEKAKWYNHQHIQRTDNERLAGLIRPYFENRGIRPEAAALPQAVALIKERCYLLSDFVTQGHFLFAAPMSLDLAAIASKWSDDKHDFFSGWVDSLANKTLPDAAAWETDFTHAATQAGQKKGALMLPLRVMLVGGKFGPGIFDIAAFIGATEVAARVRTALQQIPA